MKFKDKAGQELRTWILFFVGVALVIIFAVTGNPLSPWWTLVIGAFTCTTVIVSAVQSLAGGMSDAARKAIEDLARRESSRSDPGRGTEEPPSSTLSFVVGSGVIGFVPRFRRGRSVTI